MPEPTSATTCSGTRPRSERRASSTCRRVAGPPPHVVLDAVGEARRRVGVGVGMRRRSQHTAARFSSAAGVGSQAMSAAPVPAGPRGLPCWASSLAFRRDPLAFLSAHRPRLPGRGACASGPGLARRLPRQAPRPDQGSARHPPARLQQEPRPPVGEAVPRARACSPARASSTRASGGSPSRRSTGSASGATRTTWCGARCEARDRWSRGRGARRRRRDDAPDARHRLEQLFGTDVGRGGGRDPRGPGHDHRALPALLPPAFRAHPEAAPAEQRALRPRGGPPRRHRAPPHRRAAAPTAATAGTSSPCCSWPRTRRATAAA